MYASPASAHHHSIYLHQGGQDYLMAGSIPTSEHDMSVRLMRKAKRKREKTQHNNTGSANDADSSEESDVDSLSLTSSSTEDLLTQRSRSASSEHQAFDIHNENSNSSQVSDESARAKNSHRRRKILVTEEKMADALRELHLDLKMFDAASLHSILLQQHQKPAVTTDSEMANSSAAPKSSDISFVDFEDDDEEGEADESETTLVISDELKETLKLFDEQRAKEITKYLASVQLSKRSENLCSADKMQLVPYKKSPVIAVLAQSHNTNSVSEAAEATSSSPFKHFKSNRSILTTQNLNTLDSASSSPHTSGASDMPPSNAAAPACPYRVEEPIEKYLEKQSLKRTYAQVSKISIEELGSVGTGRFATALRPTTNLVVQEEQPTTNAAAYYVDDEPTDSTHNSSRPIYMNRINDASTYRQGDSNNNIRFKISEITDEAAEQMEL